MFMKDKNKSVKLAILGIGTVGGGTFRIIENSHDLILQRAGVDLRVSRVLARSPEKAYRLGIPEKAVTSHIEDILEDDSIDVVVEAIGGIEPATSYMLKAMQKGKSVVTPNKAAVAKNWAILHEAAEKNDVTFRFEAAVGGGIPIITSIKEQLVGNNFTEVRGILNGTSNYILTKMADDNLPYDEVLKDAQDKGFAEADPTADVEGLDAANKLSILIALCFNMYVDPETIPTRGISRINEADIRSAEENKQKIKLIASARLEEGKLTCKVGPELLTEEDVLYNVNDEYNAISVTGDAVGEIMMRGKGAGAFPTGSAVVGDIVSASSTILLKRHA
jgi:homoserine dehydrogenase